jgi:hypothetical protein
MQFLHCYEKRVGEAMTTILGYLGLGSMGQPMAGRLLDAGHQLVVRDLNQLHFDLC